MAARRALRSRLGDDPRGDAGRPPLERGRVLAAALRLVDEHGLEALSMRRLAAGLDVEAMSLYHHVPGRAALLEGLAEVVLAEVRLPRGETAGWADVARGVARALRANARAHPNALPLLASLGLGSPAARRHAEDVLDVLCRAGLSPQAAFTAFLAIRSYVIGYVLWETRHAEARAAGTIAATEIDSLDAPDLPRLATLASFVATFDYDAEFERVLEVIVAGLGSTPIA